MYETLIKMYLAATTLQVRSPIPHLVGPPGSGKSTIVAEVAKAMGVQLHIINVSRISPLELEGLQMPVDDNTRLELLIARYWTALKPGDIVLFDEFLRGLPEVYNGLLDIFTARRVHNFELPEVFIVAASNSFTTYDPALEDRLFHIKVPDPRKNRGAFEHLGKLFVSAVGLLPSMGNSAEMRAMLELYVLPTYAMLDEVGGQGRRVHATHAPMGSSEESCSLRKLIGQTLLRHVEHSAVRELLHMNNLQAMRESKEQFVVLLDVGRWGDGTRHTYITRAQRLLDSGKLTPLQVANVHMNLQLLELESTKEEEVPNVPDPF